MKAIVVITMFLFLLATPIFGQNHVLTFGPQWDIEDEQENLKGVSLDFQKEISDSFAIGISTSLTSKTIGLPSISFNDEEKTTLFKAQPEILFFPKKNVLKGFYVGAQTGYSNSNTRITIDDIQKILVHDTPGFNIGALVGYQGRIKNNFVYSLRSGFNCHSCNTNEKKSLVPLNGGLGWTF